MAELKNAVSQADFARLMRFKPGYVSQLKREGRLVLSEDGKSVLVAESRAQIEGTRDPSKAGVADRHERERAAKASGPEDDQDEGRDEPEAPEKGSSAYQEARARREHYGALSAQRDFEKSMGNLLDARDVEDAVATAVIVFRSRLEALRYSLAPQLAAESDEGRVSALIADEHEQALKELNRQLGNLAKAADV